MTINEWIENYASENDIEIPDGIADNDFLILNSGGGSNKSLVKINCEYVEDVGVVIDKTFAELYEMCKSGKIAYFVYGEEDEFSTLDDTYAYVSSIYTLSKVYKYNDAYRVCFNCCSQGFSDGRSIATPSTMLFECVNSEDFPVFYDCITLLNDAITGVGVPW